MSKKIIILAAMVSVLLVILSDYQRKVQASLPEGWFLAGGRPASYEVYREKYNSISGNGAVALRNINGPQDSFGTFMASMNSKKFNGKRVRVSLALKFEEVSRWTGLWMRADTPTKPAAAFYNSEDLHLKGSLDWRRYQVVLDIPNDANLLSYGVLLAGSGTVWFDDFKFEVVGRDVPLSEFPATEADELPDTPVLL